MRITHGVGMTIIIMGPVSDRMFSDTFSKKKTVKRKNRTRSGSDRYE